MSPPSRASLPFPHSTPLGHHKDSPDSSAGKESVCKARDLGSIPGLGRSSGEGNGNPLQHS